MSEDNGNLYTEDVIHFVSQANDFCLLIESVSHYQKPEYIRLLHRSLSQLYNAILSIPINNPMSDEGNEKYVTEEDWTRIRDDNSAKLGQYDTFLEVFDPRMQESEIPAVASIAENIADIYQDIKNFVLLYQIGTNEVMNDAIWEIVQNFEEFWGQKASNTIRALHKLVYDTCNLEEDNVFESDETSTIDTNEWIITKRFEQQKDDERI